MVLVADPDFLKYAKQFARSICDSSMDARSHYSSGRCIAETMDGFVEAFSKKPTPQSAYEVCKA